MIICTACLVVGLVFTHGLGTWSNFCSRIRSARSRWRGLEPQL